MAKFTRIEADTLPEAYESLVPEYKSAVLGTLFLSVARWDNRYGAKVALVNPKRAVNRSTNYVDPEEVERTKERLARGKDCSVRFGVSKEGRGYHGERGDFCLIGGAIDGRKLTLLYRSLELIGGFGYDLALINQLCKDLDWQPKSVVIMAARANVFALKRNSNEKFYPKLRKILELE